MAYLKTILLTHTLPFFVSFNHSKRKEMQKERASASILQELGRGPMARTVSHSQTKCCQTLKLLI